MAARKQITTELKETLQKIPSDKQAIAGRLADELIFMKETLEALKVEIRSKGTIEMFEQGSQKFLRENPALKSYNLTVQRYSQLYKQLTDLMPKEIQAEKAAGVYEFLKEGLKQ